MKKLFAIVFALVFVICAGNVLSATYIGNSNSKKFHYSDCRTVAKMNPVNKVTLNSREEAVSQGYVPCKVCKP